MSARHGDVGRFVTEDQCFTAAPASLVRCWGAIARFHPFGLIVGYQRSYGCADRARGREQSALSAGRRLPELLSIYPCLRPAALMTGSHLASSASTCFFSASGVDPTGSALRSASRRRTSGSA